MTHLDHLYALREQHVSRLQAREIQQAAYGISADPSITNDIKQIAKELAILDAKISLHAEFLNLFQRYEVGFPELLDRLGEAACRGQVLNYQLLLRRHVDRVREAGDSPSDSAERERIVQDIDAVVIPVIGESFSEICGIAPGSHINALPPPVLPPSKSIQPAGRSSNVASPTNGPISAQNVVSGNQTIGALITVNNTNYIAGAEPRHQRAIQRSEQALLRQHIIALERAVKEHATPTLIEAARKQALDLQLAFDAVDVSKMALVLTWFEQHVPMVAHLVQMLICDRIIIRRVNATGTEAVREFQRRFGAYNDR